MAPRRLELPVVTGVLDDGPGRLLGLDGPEVLTGEGKKFKLKIFE